MTLRRSLGLLVACGLALAGWAGWTALADPVVRAAELAQPRWPAGAPAVRLVLMSDVHASPPDMSPRRIRRLVGRINALRPDLVLIAGDFLSEKSLALYTADEGVAPLADLRARFGVYAVLGNHDHWIDGAGIRRALAKAGIHLLNNDAAQAGPLVIGGLDDAFTGRDNLARTLAAMRRLPGARILLSHSPDPFPALPADVTLMLAGHTHCGQIRFPVIGAPRTMSAYGQRYACGLVRENGRTLIVTAGLGTSGLPLRLGAVPDLWLIHLGPR